MPNAPSLSLPVLTVFSLYIILICLVAAVLYVAVNKLEPNRHYASVIKLLIVAVAVAAIFNQLARSSLRKKSSPQPARGTHAITRHSLRSRNEQSLLRFSRLSLPRLRCERPIKAQRALSWGKRAARNGPEEPPALQIAA